MGMKWYHLVGALWVGASGLAQAGDEELGPVYFEDQFYIGITYNFIRNQPENLAQRNLSYGLNAGFIKDIPINRTGTKALGVGLGLGLNTYYSNLIARESSTEFRYRLDNASFDIRRSKLETHLLEVPIEFRWRNSTASEYRFWRIYTGLKFGYVLGARSKFVAAEFKESFFNTDVVDLQYGLTLNVGYNTFNVHIYYGLNDLFGDEVLLNEAPLGFRPLHVGLIFYIL
jgi:hypothetical protein